MCVCVCVRGEGRTSARCPLLPKTPDHVRLNVVRRGLRGSRSARPPVTKGLLRKHRFTTTPTTPTPRPTPTTAATSINGLVCASPGRGGVYVLLPCAC